MPITKKVLQTTLTIVVVDGAVTETQAKEYICLTDEDGIERKSSKNVEVDMTAFRAFLPTDVSDAVELGDLRLNLERKTIDYDTEKFLRETREGERDISFEKNKNERIWKMAAQESQKLAEARADAAEAKLATKKIPLR